MLLVLTGHVKMRPMRKATEQTPATTSIFRLQGRRDGHWSKIAVTGTCTKTTYTLQNIDEIEVSTKIGISLSTCVLMPTIISMVKKRIDQRGGIAGS